MRLLGGTDATPTADTLSRRVPFYHATLRGNHRQDIFFRPEDRTRFDELTAETLERYVARLHGYCWMTNHVHLFAQVGDEPLGTLIRDIAGRYARSVQRHLRTTGHLFENRHHAVLVDHDEYLLTLLRYIHLNPVRAHMVQHPDQYAWSSHRVYLGRATQPWVTTDFALAMFHPERARAVAAYQRFIDDDVAHPAVALARVRWRRCSRERRVPHEIARPHLATKVHANFR